jgi:hypothetical protein
MDKPAFDPTQPFQVGDKPPFDPSKPFDAAPSVGMGEDAAKSIGSGLATATIGMLGGVGDIRDLASQGVDAIGSKLGVDLSGIKSAASMSPLGGLNVLPNSADVRSTVTDPIVSPDYQPQYAFNRVLKKGAEFAPNMLVGGPEGLGAKFLTNVAAPAVASEIGGQIAGPMGEAAGALVGASGANKAVGAFREAKALRAATPSLADVKNEASNTYDALTARNVATPIPQSTLDNVADDIKTTLNNRGIRPSNASSIHQAIDEIRTPATAGAADVADLVAARQSIKELLGKPDTNKAGAFVALNKIEKEIEQNSPGTMQSIKEADKNWGAMKANEALDKKIARADLRAAGADSGMNVGNKIRQKVADLLLSNEAKYLPAETKSDLEKIVRGTWTQNGMRHVANLLGGGGGLGMLAGAGAGYEAGGLPGAIAAGAAGRGFKIANNISVSRQAQRVAESIRRRSPLGQQTPALMPPKTNAALSALLPTLLASPKQ